MKNLISIIAALFLVSSLSAQKNNKTIDSLTKGMKLTEGVINAYTNDDNKMYFEINKDFLKQMNLSSLGLKENEIEEINDLLAQSMELSWLPFNLELTNTDFVPESNDPNFYVNLV